MLYIQIYLAPIRNIVATYPLDKHHNENGHKEHYDDEPIAPGAIPFSNLGYGARFTLHARFHTIHCVGHVVQYIKLIVYLFVDLGGQLALPRNCCRQRLQSPILVLEYLSLD